MNSGGFKTAADYNLQKKLAAEDSMRVAREFVHKHEDLIVGASHEEIERAVEKIASALRELSMAKLDWEIAKRKALAEYNKNRIGVDHG